MNEEKAIYATAEGAMRAALEAVKEYQIKGIDSIDDFEKMKAQIDAALAMKSPTIEEIRDEAFQAGYRQKEEGVRAHEEFHSNELQRAVRKAYEDGKNISEVRTISAQPYEIQTDAGVKYSAKGEMQPEASVRITRRLEDDTELSQLIKADLSRGVEEITAAIDEIRKKGAR